MHKSQSCIERRILLMMYLSSDDCSESGWGSTINCSLPKYTLPCWAGSCKMRWSYSIRGNPHHTKRQKRHLCSAMESRKEQSLCCPNLNFRKPPLIPTLLGRLTKKKNKKAQSHSLLPFPYVCSTSQFPTELQFHTSYRWLSQLHKRQTDGYRTIPGKCPRRPDISLCICSHHQKQRNKSCVVTVKISTMTKCRY